VHLRDVLEIQECFHVEKQHEASAILHDALQVFALVVGNHLWRRQYALRGERDELAGPIHDQADRSLARANDDQARAHIVRRLFEPKAHPQVHGRDHPSP